MGKINLYGRLYRLPMCKTIQVSSLSMNITSPSFFLINLQLRNVWSWDLFRDASE